MAISIDVPQAYDMGAPVPDNNLVLELLEVFVYNLQGTALLCLCTVDFSVLVPVYLLSLLFVRNLSDISTR